MKGKIMADKTIILLPMILPENSPPLHDAAKQKVERDFQARSAGTRQPPPRPEVAVHLSTTAFAS